MHNLNTYLNELKQDLSAFDRGEVLEYLIDLGRDMEEFPEEKKTKDNLVPGCTSHVYIHAENRDGKLYFTGNAGSLIVGGFVAILMKALNGLSKEEICGSKETIENFVKDTDINVNLVASRANAFANVYVFMLKKAKCF